MRKGAVGCLIALLIIPCLFLVAANGLIIALVAAIATYGAVYFAQGKRIYE